MKAERLLRLAEFLDTIPAERFDLSSWVGDGTTACAMGWAATMPEFRELGLKIASQGLRDVEGEPEDGHSSSAYAIISGYSSSDAIISIFGPEAEEEVLFYPGGWGSGGGGEDSPTPRGFANRIRRFVKEFSE